MAKAADVLIVVAPGGPATRHIVNAEVLEALGPDGVLINVARGSLVDEKALIEALRNKTILAAGLDVFENEPSVPPELIALDNAVLLPHVGSASVRTRRAMAQCVDRQRVRLGRRQTAAHSGARDAMAGALGAGRGVVEAKEEPAQSEGRIGAISQSMYEWGVKQVGFLRYGWPRGCLSRGGRYAGRCLDAPRRAD